MKILYIYHEYFNRRKRYGDELKAYGDVTFYHVGNKHDGKPIPPEMLDGMDMVWMLSNQYVYSGIVGEDFIKKAKRHSIPLVTYSTVAVSVPLEEWAPSYEPFDWAFIHNVELTKKLKKMVPGTKFMFMPVGFYKDQYHCNFGIKPTLDISFCGNPQSVVSPDLDRRVKWLRKLTKKFNIKIYGKNLCKRVGCKERPYSTHEKQRGIYWATKVNLDLPFMNTNIEEYKELIHLKNRIFDIPASGGLLLTQDCKDARLMYPDAPGFMFYKSLDDLVDKAKYMLDKYHSLEVERRKLCEYAMTHHQFKHRFKEMFEIMGYHTEEK